MGYFILFFTNFTLSVLVLCFLGSIYIESGQGLSILKGLILINSIIEKKIKY